MSLLEERIKRSAKNRPPPSAAASAVKPPQTPSAANPTQTSPDARSGLRAPRPASAYYASDNKNVRNEGSEDQRAQARPVSGVFALELEQTVQRAAGLRGNMDASIHIDLVPVNFDDILNEAVPMPRYK